MDDEDAGKKDKSSVNYRPADSDQRCKTCRYSYGPTGQRRCKRVAGIIQPDDTCDLWEAKRGA
jgi:hypothetical protein